MKTTPHPSKPFVGAWELIAGSYTGEDQKLIDYSQAGIKSLKVLSESKFSFVTISEGTFYAAGGGDYTAGDGLYVEIPTLASHADMLGKRFEFQYRLEGDTWENSRFQNGVRVEYEVWRKV